MFEAWQEGAAIACSDVTSLPEQAGGNALLFDPYNVISIAEAIEYLWFNEEERVRLRI